jgi:hypothetical protein
VDVVDQPLLPERLCHEPAGRLLLNGREVGVYRCEIEREALLLEIERETVVLAE